MLPIRGLMPPIDTARFQLAEEYTAYLATTAGRLRLDLAWMNLREFLPSPASGGRALDVGCGPATLALRLAELGFDVDLLDTSAPMLDMAREQAARRNLTAPPPFHPGDPRQLPQLFAPSSFDVVLCHNLLEFADDPFALLRGIAAVLKE